VHRALPTSIDLATHCARSTPSVRGALAGPIGRLIAPTNLPDVNVDKKKSEMFSFTQLFPGYSAASVYPRNFAFRSTRNPSGGPRGPRMNAVAREAIEYRQIAVLRDISQGWGEATTSEDTMATIVRWRQAALEAPGASLRLLLPSATDRLRVRMSSPSNAAVTLWRGPQAGFLSQRSILGRSRKARRWFIANAARVHR
jgi:hypothetical protein